MSVTVTDVRYQLWQTGTNALLDPAITDYITKANTQALLLESRLSGTTLDAVVLELVLVMAYTFLREPELARLKQDRANELIDIARSGYNSTQGSTDTVDTYPTKTIGRISNDLLRDLPGSYDTHNRKPI